MTITCVYNLMLLFETCILYRLSLYTIWQNITGKMCIFQLERLAQNRDRNRRFSTSVSRNIPRPLLLTLILYKWPDQLKNACTCLLLIRNRSYYRQYFRINSFVTCKSVIDRSVTETASYKKHILRILPFHTRIQ